MLSPLERRRFEAAHDRKLDCSPADLALRRAQREADRKQLEADRRLHRWQSLSPANQAKIEAKRAAAADVDHAEWLAACDAAEAEWHAIERRFDHVCLHDDEAEAEAAFSKYQSEIAEWHRRNDSLFLPRKPMTNVLKFPTATATVALQLSFFNECDRPKPKKWLIKNVLAAGENSSIFGPPGSLKSALLTDLGYHLAAGLDWRGFKLKQRRGVVFFSFERADQLRRRLAAYAQRDGARDLPIAVASAMLDLINPACVETVVATVKEAERRFGMPVGLIVFDTLNKGIAAGGGDENHARDQNMVAANLRRIHEKLDLHIAGVGHCGKDETRGERGSNARQGDIDLEIQISGDEIKTATVTKANDQPEGPLTSFRGEVVHLGEDEDGDAIEAFILSKAACPVAPKIAKLSDRAVLALDALRRAIAEHGQDGAVTVDCWRDELFASGVLDRDSKNPRQDYKRLRDGLAKANRISERDGIVRLEFGQRRLPMTPEIPLPFGTGSSL